MRRVILLLLLVAPHEAMAQLVTFDVGRPRTVQALSVAYHLFDFEYDGDEEPLFTLNFGEPALGVVYSRPSLLVTFGLGTQQAGHQEGSVVVADTVDLRLVDLSLATWGPLYIAAERTGAVRFFVPIVLYTNYRRVAPRGEGDSFFDSFTVTSLGVGAGGGMESYAGGLVFEARVNPVIALATTSLGDNIGSLRLLDLDVQVHTPPLAGRFGLSAGYSFRRQVWNVDASGLIDAVTDNLFDYDGQQHILRVGISW